MRPVRIAVFGAAVLVAAGCSSSSGSEDLAVEVDPASGTIAITSDDGGDRAEGSVLEGTTEESSTSAVPPIPEVPDVLVPVEGEVDGEGVLVAAIVVATGDVEAALDEGVVTPAEVEAAIRAIDDGTLSEWISE